RNRSLRGGVRVAVRISNDLADGTRRLCLLAKFGGPVPRIVVRTERDARRARREPEPDDRDEGERHKHALWIAEDKEVSQPHQRTPSGRIASTRRTTIYAKPASPMSTIHRSRERHSGVTENGAVSSTTIRKPMSETTKNSSSESAPRSDNPTTAASIQAVCA